eukprot:1707337-Pleurochrysis_carterae.AAC.1
MMYSMRGSFQAFAGGGTMSRQRTWPAKALIGKLRAAEEGAETGDKLGSTSTATGSAYHSMPILSKTRLADATHLLCTTLDKHFHQTSTDEASTTSHSTDLWHWWKLSCLCIGNACPPLQRREVGRQRWRRRHADVAADGGARRRLAWLG